MSIPWYRQVLAYVAALSEHWGTLMGGIGVTLLVFGVQLYTHQELPPFVYGGALAFTFVIAGFKAWQDQYKKTVEDKTRSSAAIAERDAKLETRERNKRIRERLATFAVEGLEIKERCLAADKAGQAEIEKASEEWHEPVTAYVRENLDESYLYRLRDWTGTPVRFSGNVPEYQRQLNDALWRMALRLQEFIRERVD
jgi:hypothetical protein